MRSTLKIGVLSLSVATLAACGGGGSDTTVVVPTPTPTNTATSSNTATTPSTNTSANTNTAASSNATPTPSTNTNTSANANTATKPTTTTSDKPVSTVALDKQFSNALQRGFNGMTKGTYSGLTLTLDNTNKTVTGTRNGNVPFDDFDVGGAKVLLLERVNDKLSYVPVRKLTSNDFKSGFAPKDPNNVGYVGSRFGSRFGDIEQDQLQSFGSLRYGVYTDANNKTHLFVHGNPADRVFKGEYLGSAIMGKDGVYEALPNAVKAIVSSDLSQVDVSINTNSGALRFGGAISGNTFTGVQNGVETKGGFYGNSLGGIFQVTEGTHKDKNGVFGAALKTKDLEDAMK